MEDALDPTVIDPAPDVVDEAPPGPTEAPFGTWSSPIRIDDLVADVVRLAEPWLDGDDVYWIEGRPAEAGRRVLVRASRDGTTVDLTPAPFNVRTHVHEYGGGSYVVAGGTVVFSHFADGRLYRLDPGDETPVAITPEGQSHYADLRFDAGRRRFLAVREDHGVEGEPPGGRRRDRARRRARAAGPRRGPRLPGVAAAVARRRRPWPGSSGTIRTCRGTRHGSASRGSPTDGSLGPSDLAAGGPEESIVQPEWSPDGVAPPDQRPDRLVEPLPAGRGSAARAAGRDGGRVRRPGLDLRSLVATGSCPTARSSRSPGPRAATGSSTSSPAGWSARSTPGFTELDGLRVGADKMVALAGSPAEAAMRGRVRPDDPGPVGGPAPIELRSRSTRAPSRSPRRSTSRRPAAGSRMPCTTRPPTTRSPARTGSGRRSSCCRTAVRPRTPRPRSTSGSSS